MRLTHRRLHFWFLGSISAIFILRAHILSFNNLWFTRSSHLNNSSIYNFYFLMVDWLSDGSYIQWVSEPSRRLTLDLWLAKDNRFLNLKSSYKLVLSVQKVDQQGHEGEGKVLRVLLSGRWLPRNQGWLNFWETKLVTVRKSLHRSCWTELTCQGILLP